MSQKKMEAYREAKKNKAANEKKAKRKKILNWTIGILIALLLIGASGFLVYYTDVMLPKKQAEAESISGNTIDVSDLIQMNTTSSDDAEGTVESSEAVDETEAPTEVDLQEDSTEGADAAE